jgi:hypothetical protein
MSPPLPSSNYVKQFGIAYENLPIPQLSLLVEATNLVYKLENEPRSDSSMLENLDTLYDYHAKISILPESICNGMFVIESAKSAEVVHKALTDVQENFREDLLSHMRGLLKELSAKVEGLQESCKIPYSNLDEYVKQVEYASTLGSQHITFVSKLMSDIIEIQARMAEHGLKISSDDSFTTRRVQGQVDELVSTRIGLFKESLLSGRTSALESLRLCVDGILRNPTTMRSGLFPSLA